MIAEVEAIEGFSERGEPDLEFIIEERSGHKIWGICRNLQDWPCSLFMLQAPDGRFARGRLYASEGNVAGGDQYHPGYTREAQIPHMLKEVLDTVARLPRANIRSPATEGRWELKPVQGNEWETVLRCEQNVIRDDGEEGGSVVGPLLWQENDWRLHFERGLLEDTPPFCLTWTTMYSPECRQPGLSLDDSYPESEAAEASADGSTDTEEGDDDDEEGEQEEPKEQDLLEFGEDDDPEDGDYGEDDFDP